MSNDNDNAESLELQKVLAASLAYTQKEFRRAKRELIEEFKEVLDPDTGERIRVLEIKGARGPQGARGEQGLVGPQGARGDRGPAGIDGKMGVQGIMGPQGEKGDPGEKGVQGEKGDKGDDADVTRLVDQIEILKDDFRQKFGYEMPDNLVDQAIKTGRYDNPKHPSNIQKRLDREYQENLEKFGMTEKDLDAQLDRIATEPSDDKSDDQQGAEKKKPPVIYDPLDKSRVIQQGPTVDTPSTTTASGDSIYDIMREIAGTKEEAKKEAFANAMIQLGAGVASGNLAAGLSAAGKAASETMGNYRDRALKGRLAEVQLKRADEQAAYRRRQEELSERREDRYSVTQANTALAKRLDEANFYITIPALLTEKL